MSNDTMTVWGFWITVAGTSLGLISLLLAMYISVNTTKIRNNFMNKHLQEKYRKTKGSIMLQFVRSYSLLKDDDILDVPGIDECIISLHIYNDILSKPTKSKLKNLQKKIEIDTMQHNANGKKAIRKLMYEIIKRLENELDEQEEYLKEVTK